MKCSICHIDLKGEVTYRDKWGDPCCQSCWQVEDELLTKETSTEQFKNKKF